MDVNNITTVPPLDFNIDERGMGRIYYDCMSKNKNKIALIDGLTNYTVTYEELLSRSIRTAIALKNDNLKYGDVIVIYCYNHMDSTTILLGGFFLNVIVVGIDDKSPLEHVIQILNEIKPKVVFVSERTLPTLTEAMDLIAPIFAIVVIDSKTTNYVFFENYIHTCTEEQTFEPVDVESLDDIAMIFFTSGTTGFPKGVCRSHLSLLYCQYNIIALGHCWDVVLEFNSPAWAVYMNSLSIPILLGTTRVVFPNFLPEYSWQFAKHKVTCMILGVWKILRMCRYKRINSIEPNCLKTIVLAGSVLSSSQMRTIKETFSGVDICNTYGQTETGVIFLPSPSDHKEFDCTKSECVGKGLPGISYKVTDVNEGKVLGSHQKGELRVKMVYPLGYYYKTDSSFMYDEEGWYKTGDLAYFDDHRRFYIVDRIKDTFKFEQYLIVPSFIEDVIMKHPAVEKAFVTGIPDDNDGEHPIALVTLKEDAERVTPEDIQQFVDGKVLNYQRLRGGVKVIDKFVVTVTGKIDRSWARKTAFNLL